MEEVNEFLFPAHGNRPSDWFINVAVAHWPPKFDRNLLVASTRVHFNFPAGRNYITDTDFF